MEARFNQGACSEFEALLEDHLAGDLSGADAKKLAEHLESCAACSSALELAAPSVELLRTVPPSADPGPGFSRVVMARIRAEMSKRGEQKSIWLPFISLAWRFAATATLALAVLVTFDAVRHSQYGPQTNLNHETVAETRDLFPDPSGPPANRDEVLMMVADTDHGKH
ncbi:MAG TPA: anti-sigma factor [Candidatus Acidoferrales bacterium]|jgi:anti-sigma factor RsiW|nr:anti-sigma factor [Candidatus Acidoferrales bacterium]